MTPNQNVKDVLKLLSEFATKADEVMIDGKVTWMEVAGAFPLLLTIPGTFPKFKPALEELQNADDASKADIILYAQTELDLSNDKTEGIVEDLLAILTYGVSLSGRFSKK